MSKFTDIEGNVLRELALAFPLSILKRKRKEGAGNSVSIAVSKSGAYYIGGKVESDTNLLDIPSEQTALLYAAQAKDYRVRKIITLSEDLTPSPSPIVLKILIDFAARTRHPIEYRIVNTRGKSVFRSRDVAKTLPLYQSELAAIFARSQEKPATPGEPLTRAFSPRLLHSYALRGLESAFTTRRGATRYGAAVVTKEGRVYWSGQYSSPDKRLGLHAEMGALLAAHKAGERPAHLGVVSDTFLREPCEMCGCCRQFISEVSRKLGLTLSLYAFAKNTPAHHRYSIGQLLPHTWTSKKW